MNDLQGLIVNPFAAPETEDALIRLESLNEGKVEADVILVSQFDIPVLPLVAHVLAKGVVLTEYEAETAQVFDLIEPYAANLQNQKNHRQGGKGLLKQICNGGRNAELKGLPESGFNNPRRPDQTAACLSQLLAGVKVYLLHRARSPLNQRQWYSRGLV